jgi:putative membrane protein
MTGDDAVGPPERLHPFFLLTGLGGSLRGVVGGYAGIGYLAATGRLQIALIGAVVLLLFMMASVYLYWRRFEFRVGANEIRIDHGVLSRTHRSIPFDRIQDVDISQGPVARLLGLAKVKLETGSSGNIEKDEGVLHAIALERAEALRRQVREHRAPAETVAAHAADTEQPPIFAMDLRRVVLAGVFSFSLALFGGLVGASQTFGEVIGFDPFSRSFWRGAAERGGPFAEYLEANAAAAAVGGVLVLVLIGLATGVTRSLLRDYGFRLDRGPTGLRRRRGLLTRTDVTLPLRRVQAAVIASGPVRERFGWHILKLQSLAHDEGKEADHSVAPLATPDEVDSIFAEIGWRPAMGDVAWRPVSKAYVWTLAIGLVPLLLLAAIQAVFVPWIGAAAAAVIAAALTTRWLAWRRTGFVTDGDRLIFRTGWWRRRTVVLPRRRVQSIDIAQSFVSRWFGTASLLFGVAGGNSLSNHMIPALPRETARQLRDQLLIIEP